MKVSVDSSVPVGALVRRFLPYVKAISGRAALNVLLVLIAPLVSAALLWSFKILLDDVLIAQQGQMLVWAGGLYVCAAAAKIGVEYWGRRVEAEVVEALNLALRSDLFSHVLSLSPGSLGRTRTGDVLARLQGDVPKTEYLVYTGPLSVIADGAAALVFITLLFVLDWRLALCGLAVLPLVVLVVSRLAPAVRRASRLARRANSNWMTTAEERFAAIPVVHAFDAGQREEAAFHHLAGRVRRMETLSVVLQARQAAIVEGLVAAGGLAVLGFGATLVGSGALSVGALVAFIGAVGSLYWPVRSLAKAAGRFQNAAAGAQRVADLMDRESLVQQRPGARSLTGVRGSVELRDVHFSYPDGQQALRGLSLSIMPGEAVALVGPSGSGKSSIARLLLRQYDVSRGSVLIDGVDVRDIELVSLRQCVAPVFQDAMILSGSILDAVRYGAPEASMADILQSLKAASVEEFAAEKSGLSTPVGSHGSRLSGGQRQRLALARALLRNAPILLLDEATAGVDSETEELIQEAVGRLHGQRTQIIVAHRLSTARRADRVAVIERGLVVEAGTPEDLLGRATRCREIFSAQLAVSKAAE